jgi:hypothetical protein
MKKKIIGYKLIKPEFAKAACIIEGYKGFGESIKNGEIIFIAGKEKSFEKLDEANVLTLWFEEVLEEEFKIGDYIIVEEPGDLSWIKKGEIVQLGGDFWSRSKNSINISKNIITAKSKTHPKGSSGYSSTPISYRKATQEEIDSVTKIILPNSKYEIVVANGATNIDGYTFSNSFWQAAKTIAEHTKADIIVGCGAKGDIGNSNQWKLDLNTIQKVLDKLC